MIYNNFCHATWPLLPVGFQKAVQGARMPLKLYRLLKLKSPAIGATLLGAQHAGHKLTIDYASNTYELDFFPAVC